MGILKRVRTILASNIHARISDAEDPEHIVNQSLREIERDLREAKAEYDAIEANCKRVKRELDQCISEMEKMERYAVKALESGDEGKARNFLEEKLNFKSRSQELKAQYEVAAVHVEQMKLVQEKLRQDFTELSERRDILVGRLTEAKSKQRMNELGPSQSNVRLTAFDQLEEKAERALAEAEAIEQLKRGLDDDIERISSK
ncbi:PspA/IM30 family protein [Ornithinibacillus bavariensis]|uniref:Phage shock protein A n=1 Tax=Ornithinibacillus bavariensis TaxID=545502 RepID=A0A920C7W8_9BACI|nr:PspA/IM30 family protein [Ornithinibacillus bavariensis]GIO28093.1 phage shock protein A [Ornithinibacillus bavariensis]